MLFNSYPFLLGFLPAALALHGLVLRFRPQLRTELLLGLSLVFYGWWDWRFLPLLAGSVVANHAAARLASRRHAPALLLPLAVAANLLLLGIFKYAAVAVDALNLLPGLHLARPSIALPLGISFFTFHHVMYLADLGAGRAPRFTLAQYGFYIAFFPQVLAGPLVRWSEVMGQLGERPDLRPDAAERFARGLALLAAGLAKKVFLGDPLAGVANPVFAAAAEGRLVTVLDAWQGTGAFALGIYFDFSGYTDMALGLGLMFGIVLPRNFDAPYRSTSLRDFWRRWHMTLSRFLRDYLYVPLGGNRRGLAVQIGALLATMGLGGLWHGAGPTFVAWGLVHGAGLGIHLLWRRSGRSLPAPAGWLLTGLFVVFAWVLFRAAGFEAAGAVYRGLLGLAPGGGEPRWRILAVAGAVATLGPTSWGLAHRLPPTRLAAAAVALVLALAVLRIGDDANYDFIYFRF